MQPVCLVHHQQERKLSKMRPCELYELCVHVHRVNDFAVRIQYECSKEEVQPDNGWVSDNLTRRKTKVSKCQNVKYSLPLFVSEQHEQQHRHRNNRQSTRDPRNNQQNDRVRDQSGIEAHDNKAVIGVRVHVILFLSAAH
jgi:hypothetical protein